MPPSTLKRRLPFLLLILLPLVPLWHAVLTGDAIGPFDQIRQMAPWNGPKPAQPWDVLQADGVLQFFPWRDMVLEAWGKGQMPLWNPYELAGTPLLANSQSAGFYPPHILLGLLHVPTTWAITLLAWFHLAWAGLGVYFLSRKIGATSLGAWIAGASFSLSPFMLGWTALASVITTVSWIPWVLGCIVAICREPAVRPSNSRVVVSTTTSEGPGGETVIASKSVGIVRDRLALALMGCTAMMLLSGHLQFAAYGLLAAALVAIVESVIAVSREEGDGAAVRIARLMAIPLLLVFGAALAAPQLLPVLSYSKFSHRQNAPSAEGYAAYTNPSLKLFELANLADAYALGSPRTPVDVGQTTISQYWPALVKRGANFSESAVTVGPLVLALLFLVPWKRRETWSLAAIGVLGLLLALGTALNWPLYYLVPGWSASGSPGRVVVLFVLAACALASLGCSVSASRVSALRAGGGLLLGLILAFVAPMLAPASPSGAAAAVEALKGAATSATMPGLIISLALAVAALALLMNPKAAKWQPTVVAFPLLLCWVGYGSDLIMTGKPLDPIQGIAPDARVAFINQPWDILTAVHAVAPPNTASISRIHELAGYDSLLHRDTVSMLQQVDGKNPAPDANGNIMYVKPSASDAELASAGVSVKEDVNGATPIVGAPGRFSMSGGSASVISEGYDHLTLKATGSGALTVRDRMMPGWEATVDGARAEMPEGLWRVVQLNTPGEHRVEFRYSPPGLKTGVVVGGIAWIAFVLAGIATWRSKQNGSPELADSLK